jgi:hypothetical protein
MSKVFLGRFGLHSDLTNPFGRSHLSNPTSCVFAYSALLSSIFLLPSHDAIPFLATLPGPT